MSALLEHTVQCDCCLLSLWTWSVVARLLLSKTRRTWICTRIDQHETVFHEGAGTSYPRSTRIDEVDDVDLLIFYMPEPLWSVDSLVTESPIFDFALSGHNV